MKKSLAAMCAVALLGMTACQKEANEPDTAAANQGGGTPASTMSAPGSYHPGAHIASIAIDEAVSETWNWQGENLTSVTKADGSEKVSFTYGNDGRVQSFRLNGDGMLSGNVAVSYNGNNISRLTVQNDGEELPVEAVVTNNNGKPSEVVLQLTNDALLDMFNSTISAMMGSEAGESITGVDSVSASISLDWQGGDNVKTTVTHIGARLATTLGTIVSLIPDLSSLGSMGTVIQQYAENNPNTPVYIKVEMSDTATYAYDQYTNPFRHYLGDMASMSGEVPQFNVATVSANNVTEATHKAMANINIYTTISFLGTTQMIPLYNKPMPLADNYVMYEYTYREDGYPLTVTGSDDGSTKSYNYQQ